MESVQPFVERLRFHYYKISSCHITIRELNETLLKKFHKFSICQLVFATCFVLKLTLSKQSFYLKGNAIRSAC